MRALGRTALLPALSLFLGLGACSSAKEKGEPPGPVRRLALPQPGGHWEREGFVEMVPPVRLPTTTPGFDDVAIWLRIPEGGVIETVVNEDGSGAVALRFPPGTIADRVESRGRDAKARRVIDVRGTRLAEGGEEWMHTYRSAERGGALLGYEWPRTVAGAHAEGTRRLLAELEQLPSAQAMTPDARAAYLGRIETKNDCVACHSYARPDNLREGEHGVVNRGTDASGFFTPQTVLMDEVVLETYGSIDPNLRDPWVEISCPGGEAVERVKKGARLRAKCSNGQVPRARFDLPRALTHADKRAERVCTARRYLFEHLDEKGREHFTSALEPCDALP